MLAYNCGNVQCFELHSSIMAQDDFDIDRLAAYLHMMPAAVVKLAERGRLPGRRVGGEWRFSAPEIHHWLEDRIGLSDDDQLVQMEGALDSASGPAAVEEISIANLVRPEAVANPLDARTRGSVIVKMTELAARTHLLWDAEKMAFSSVRPAIMNTCGSWPGSAA
jgi:PTS system nitrogen regulatory IIA component